MHGCGGRIVVGSANWVDSKDVEFPLTIAYAVTVDVALAAN